LNHEVLLYRVINSFFFLADLVGLCILAMSFFPRFKCLKYCYHLFLYFNINMIYRISDFEHFDHDLDANWKDAFRSCMFSCIMLDIFIFVLLFYDNRRKIFIAFSILVFNSLALAYKTFKCNDMTMSEWSFEWVCITVGLSMVYWSFCVMLFINMNNDTYTQIKRQ